MSGLPPVELLNQPLNVCPSRAGVPGSVEMASSVFVDPALTALPPCVSYVTASVFAVHCAWSTMSFAKSNEACSENGVPPVPEEVVCHPLKV